MYHFYITIIYIFSCIYIFFRINRLFISKKYRLPYLVIYLVLVSVFPLSERFSISHMNSAGTGYSLAFFMYLFLSVLLYDLFLLFNSVSGLVPRGKRRSFPFRFYILTSMIILSIGVVIAGVINLKTIRVSKYSISVTGRKSGLKHLRVAYVADFHIQQNTSLHFAERFVRKVNDLQPELVLFGGDIIEGHHDEDIMNTGIGSVLRKIHSTYGSFGVPGNHELYGGAGFRTFYRKADITLLVDTVVCIDHTVYLAGRNDQYDVDRKSLELLLGNVSHDLPVIMLDHRPTQLHEVSRRDVDVQFSGHTHDGQMFPINLLIRRIYELPYGYKKIARTHFFVTSGLQLWGPPVKTAGKSEIMLVDISFD